MEEIEAHFTGMPASYWQCVNVHDFAWGLQTIHGFLDLITRPNVSATVPFVTWRELPQDGRTRVMLCTWDRRGLLAKAAASFSAVRLNILQAEVFTRADNIVLDIFSVVDANDQGVASLARLQEMTFLLEGALSEPPRFASVWACSRHKFLAPPNPFPPRIRFDNDSSSAATLVHIQAFDRRGLLYDVLQAIADCGLNVSQARIGTEGDLAQDIVHVTDEDGQKVTDPQRLDQVRLKLRTALAVTD
jgi:[protein-PII] uridylyltransferase